MTSQQIAQLALDAVVSAPVVAVIVELVKKHPSIPVSDGQAARIRSVAAVLSAVSVCLLGIAQGVLTSADVQSLVAAGVSALSAFGLAHLTYKAVKE